MTKSQMTIELPAGREQMLKSRDYNDDDVRITSCSKGSRVLWCIIILVMCMAVIFALLFCLVMFEVIPTMTSHTKEGVKMAEKVHIGEVYDEASGKCEQVYKYTLKNTKSRMILEVLDYGATITSLQVPDKSGNMVDIVLSYTDTHALKSEQDTYFGVVVGRYANRISAGRFTVDGTEYQVTVNNNGNALHGGIRGWNQAVWSATATETRHNKLTLSHVSNDGDQGYPGTVHSSVTFTLTDQGQLLIEYEATTDKATPINLTTHPYFNLGGHDSGDIYRHHVIIHADRYLPVDSNLIPTGAIADVDGTVFDLRTSTQLGDVIHNVSGGGYDHNFCLRGPTGMKLAASVEHRGSGIRMRVHTDQPGMQFYTGNFLNVTAHGKHGSDYTLHTGFCMETQNYPDAPNHVNFPDSILQPGSIYEHKVAYTFDTISN